MGFIPPLLAAAGALGGTVAAGAGTAGAIGGAAAATTAGGLGLGGLAAAGSSVLSLASAGVGIASALRKVPKPPSPGEPPTPPQFGASLVGANMARAAQSAGGLSGTVTSAQGAASTTGAKTLLGQ